MYNFFSSTIKIGQKVIGHNQPCYIIAEAGVNHGGDISMAKQLVDIAAEAGADAVKFQAFRTEALIIDSVEKAPYQQNTTSKEESQSDMLRKLELQHQQYIELMSYCKDKGIQFLITPFDEKSLEELESIGVEAYKIASTDTTNIPFLRKVAQTGKPVILSTGMCYLPEVDMAVDQFKGVNPNLILLQCTANYPIKDEEANLNVMPVFRERYQCLVGYSDHTVGPGAALYAVPMGAVVVEKHFTLDKSLEGPDHLASLSPDELRYFVKEVRKIEQYMGSSEKQPTPSEMGTRSSLQKCLVASKKILKGDFFTTENIIAKRTGGKGISPLNFDTLLSMKASRDYFENEIIDEQV